MTDHAAPTPEAVLDGLRPFREQASRDGTPVRVDVDPVDL